MLAYTCSSNSKDQHPSPDPFGGKDLYSQSSSSERILMGKWYFGYRYSEMLSGSIEISYDSGTYWPTGDRTDTIQFYSKELIGFSWDCPYENPNKSLVKLVESESASYFPWCFPSGVNGWLIEDELLTYYRGYDTNDFITYPIIEINNDSIFFLYKDYPSNDISGIDKEYAVFFKKQD
ncbi:hypothetical protein [Allotamlana fucoidanivorans]|uniref:Uncharacterized protein n=2 Tax=Allotamlana fucoidanivorans TaxID=2583814 RepID=A0A5C4SRX8_9FLAO|nr:hypothetical protein [Tamlana fucoidanivorans]TNJ47166.1 hypothetical protein FGF67_01190 [Tamlana fucoidanivorans]